MKILARNLGLRAVVLDPFNGKPLEVAATATTIGVRTEIDFYLPGSDEPLTLIVPSDYEFEAMPGMENLTAWSDPADQADLGGASVESPAILESGLRDEQGVDGGGFTGPDAGTHACEATTRSLFHVYRSDDDAIDYDETAGCVVVASSEAEALELSAKLFDRCPGPDRCVKIGSTELPPQIVIRDFRAG